MVDACKIRPALSWYLVAFLILVGGVAGAAWMIGSAAGNLQMGQQDINAGETVTLDQPGSYSVYVSQGASRRGDPTANLAWENASSAEVQVTDEQSGEPLAVRRVDEFEEVQGTQFGRIVEFDVPKSGNFTIQITPNLDPIHPRVGVTRSINSIRDEIGSFALKFMGGLAIAGLGVLIALVISVIVLVKRGSCRRRMAAAENAQPIPG